MHLLNGYWVIVDFLIFFNACSESLFFSIGLCVGVWMCVCVCLVAFYGSFILLICFFLCVC